jgi:hypothetical protein
LSKTAQKKSPKLQKENPPVYPLQTNLIIQSKKKVAINDDDDDDDTTVPSDLTFSLIIQGDEEDVPPQQSSISRTVPAAQTRGANVFPV